MRKNSDICQLNYVNEYGLFLTHNGQLVDNKQINISFNISNFKIEIKTSKIQLLKNAKISNCSLDRFLVYVNCLLFTLKLALCDKALTYKATNHFISYSNTPLLGWVRNQFFLAMHDFRGRFVRKV